MPGGLAVTASDLHTEGAGFESICVHLNGHRTCFETSASCANLGSGHILPAAKSLGNKNQAGP